MRAEVNTTDPERHLHVFSTPDLHLVVVRPDVLKVLLRDREEATRKSRRSRMFMGQIEKL